MVAVNFRTLGLTLVGLILFSGVGCDKSKGGNSVTRSSYNYSVPATNSARAAYENCDTRLYQASPQTQNYFMCDNVKVGQICSMADVHYRMCPQVQPPANQNDPNYYASLKNTYFDYLNRQDQNTIGQMTNMWNQLVQQYGQGTGQQTQQCPPYPTYGTIMGCP